MAGTLPTPTPSVGVPLCNALCILFCDPVATIKSTSFDNSFVSSLLIGSGND